MLSGSLIFRWSRLITLPFLSHSVYFGPFMVVPLCWKCSPPRLFVQAICSFGRLSHIALRLALLLCFAGLLTSQGFFSPVDRFSWYPTAIHFSYSVVAAAFVLHCFRCICLWLYSPNLLQDFSGFCNSPGYHWWNKLISEMMRDRLGASRLWKHPYNQIKTLISFLNNIQCLLFMLGS